MSFPPAHFLVGAGAAELVTACQEHPPARWKAWLVGGALAVLPDVDFVLGIARGHAAEYHGTFTHSLVAVAVVGAVAWMLAGRRWGALALAGYGSHLLVDLLDDRGRTNVLLWWPFSDQQPLAIAKIFPTVAFYHGRGLEVAVRSLLDPPVTRQLLVQSGVGAVGCLLLFLLAALVRRVRPLSRRPPASPAR